MVREARISVIFCGSFFSFFSFFPQNFLNSFLPSSSQQSMEPQKEAAAPAVVEGDATIPTPTATPAIPEPLSPLQQILSGELQTFSSPLHFLFLTPRFLSLSSLDLSQNVTLLDKAVSSKEMRYVARVLRTTSSIRRRLTPAVFAHAFKVFFPKGKQPFFFFPLNSSFSTPALSA